MPLRHALLSLAVALVPAAASAGEVLVAVAANFASPMAKIADAFGAASGHRVKLSSGATGKFYTQVAAGGAPFEVLLAADDETPRRLVAEGHAVAGSAFTYAVGRLVLWSAKPGFVDDQGNVLASAAVQRIAIANPKVAPYGQAAMEVLKARGLADTLAPRLVVAESVAQAYAFAATGNAELAFVALSQVVVPGKAPAGSSWTVPASLHGELRQDAVLLKAGAANPAARALLDYLKTAPAKAVIASYGYGP